MDAIQIERDLKHFKGTSIYYKHLYPGKSPIIITEGCNYVREQCQAYWLFDVSHFRYGPWNNNRVT